MLELITFGQAIEALKEGKRVTREGWNGKGMFIFMRPEDELSVDFIVNKVKSLPQSVKDYYIPQFAWNIPEDESGEGPKDVKVKFTSYLCMLTADGTIVNGWLASQTDMLSEDWIILD